MSLRDAAKRLSGQVRPVGVFESLPDPSRVAQQADALALVHGITDIPMAPSDLDQIQKRLVAHLVSDGANRIPSRDLRFAPQCIWDGEDPIANRPDLLFRLLRLVEGSGRRSVMRTLAMVYFRHWQPQRPGLETVGSALARMVEGRLENLYKLHVEFEAFDPNRGPAVLADICVRENSTPEKILRSYGLFGETISTGFGAEAFFAGMKYFQENLSRNNFSLVNIAVQWSDERTSQHLVPKVLASTLLLPFRETEPKESQKDQIMDILLQRIGDPRVHQNRWLGIENEANILRSWLTRVALTQFFEIVNKVAYPAHWNYRRAFWMALYEKGAISQAWVAFGESGEEEAERSFGENIKFGRLLARGKPVDGGHAVLVMQVGDYIAIDWSHNGRCVFWRKNDRNAPTLYADEYFSGDIAPTEKPSDGIIVKHDNSDRLYWQRSLAEFIRNNIGIDLRENEYSV